MSEERDSLMGRFHRARRELRVDWWHKSYVLDYLLTMAILVLTYVLTLSNFISPFRRYLPTNDPSVTYPLLPDIIPLWLLLLFAFLAPYSIFIVYHAFVRDLHDLHHAMLGTAESISLTVLCTQSLKVLAGEYRPDWANQNDRPDGREAFPSGHSAVAFASMTFLSLWISAKMGLFRKLNAHIWQMLIALAPYAPAMGIAVSRTRDYHHSFADITAGTAIGIAIAGWNYFIKYPSLSKKTCGHPKHRQEPLHEPSMEM